jgi:DNA primase
MKFSFEDWVDDNLKNPKISGGGDEREAVCPSCGKFGSFYVNVSKDKGGAYICFSCDFKGRSSVGLIAEVEGITKFEARKRLLKGSVEFKRVDPLSLVERISFLRGGNEENSPRVKIEIPLPAEFISVYDDKHKKWRMPAYLSKRGVLKETAKRFNLGFCRTGDYQHRVVFPIVCPNGHSFTARDVTNNQIPRYRNPRGAGLGRLVFGWDSLIDNHDFLVVEGPMDAVMANQAGFPAIALCGKSFGDEQSKMLRGRTLGSAVVMLDPEEGVAPIDVATKLLSLLEDVYIAKLPSGKDPGSATPLEISRAYDDSCKFRGQRALRSLGILADSRKKLEKIFPSKTDS